MEEVNHLKMRRFSFKKLIFILIALSVILFAYQNDLLNSPNLTRVGSNQNLNTVNNSNVSNTNAPIPNFFNSVKDYIASLFNSDRDISEIVSTREIVVEESQLIDVIEDVSPSVVSIVVSRVGFNVFSGPFQDEGGIGTGFIVDPSGLIVTNSHVVNDPSGEYSVVLNDGTTYEVTEIHLDEATDLAIIEIVARNLPVANLGDSNNLKLGQTAIAIGNALGEFSNTVTVGVVSGIARELTASGGLNDIKTYENAIQTDAALNPGNSGGPLLNLVGNVIGINVATTQGAENIGFAIPVNTLKPILEGFLAEGRIVRPYIGVAYTIITSTMADLRDLPAGAYVSRVIADSPADKAGIVRGDIITKLAGMEINESNSLSSVIRDREVGDNVEVIINRNGSEINLNLVLEESPDSVL